MNILISGSRADMAWTERFLVLRARGPMNHERWADIPEDLFFGSI
jgi:hypothetical protein